MNTSRRWLSYTLIRLGIFAVALAILLLLRINPYLATVIAAIVGFCLSYLFLRRPREELAKGIAELRRSDERVVQHDRDNDYENEVLDRMDDDARLDEDKRDGEA